MRSRRPSSISGAASPPILGTEPPLYFSNHIVGCLVIMVAVTAMAEVVRPVRFVNVALSAWIAVSPFLLDGGTAVAALVHAVTGVALIGLSLPRGARSDQHYGGWDRAIA